MKYTIILGFLFCALSSNAQFTYTFVSMPDSAEVMMNGEKKCFTPCKVKYYWREKKDGHITFSVEKNGYKKKEVLISEKPTDFDRYDRVILDIKYPVLDLKSTPLIAFDKVRADIKDGKVIGEKKFLKRASESITWSGSIKVGDESFEESFYDVATNMGFNTLVTESSQLFSENSSRKRQLPRFIIGAEIEEFNINYKETEEEDYSDGKTIGHTQLGFKWQVLDQRNSKVVLALSNEAETHFRQSRYQQLTYIEDVFNLALVKFLKSEEFIKLLESGESSYVPEQEDEEKKKVVTLLDKIELPKFTDKSELIKGVKDACVTIVTDGGHGSGAVISEDGLILTAYHVVEGVNKIEIKFANGLVLPASIEQFDEFNDVAIVKIPGNGYKALPLYSGNNYGLGTDVLTIGTPYDIDLGQSISKGILSGKREKEGHIYLQLDMAVSPGNSGGPLLNDKGEILGVIQRKIVDTGIEGIGFAIPSDKLIEALNLKIK